MLSYLTILLPAIATASFIIGLCGLTICTRPPLRPTMQAARSKTAVKALLRGANYQALLATYYQARARQRAYLRALRASAYIGLLLAAVIVSAEAGVVGVLLLFPHYPH